MFKHSKLKKTLSLFLVLTLFLAVLPSTSLAEQPAENKGLSTASSIYDPTTAFPNYAAAKTTQEKLAASQLPEASLKTISTAELIKKILSTPLLAIDIFTANDKRYGDAIDYVAHWYNTVTELSLRADSGTALLAAYLALDFEALAEDDGAYGFLSDNAPLILELLLGRDVHFARLTNAQKETLFRTATSYVGKKQVYSVGNAYANLFIDNLGSAASTYYAENIAQTRGDTSTSDYVSETIKTYGGLSFTAHRWVGTYDYYLAHNSTKDAETRASYPGIVYQSTATEKYNCHSYAWHRRSDTNTLWINDPGTYISCSSSSETSASSGTIVVYYSSTSGGSILHSGVVSSVSGGTIMVTSKWGDLPLYSHELSNVPNGYKTSSGQVAVKYFSYTVHKYDGLKYAVNNSGYLDTVQHHTCCSLCYESNGSSENHTFAYTSYSENKHKIGCTGCNLVTFNIYEPHVIGDWTSVSETNHGKLCEKCGYQQQAEAHGYGGWGTYDSTYHRRFCLTCGHYDYEAHTPNSSNTLCTVCNATGPFSPIMKSLGVENEPEEHDHGGDCCGH